MSDVKDTSTVELDGNKLTQEELNEQKKRKDIRIIEAGEAGKYKTLKKFAE